jgi:hypothetical protein
MIFLKSLIKLSQTGCIQVNRENVWQSEQHDHLSSIRNVSSYFKDNCISVTKETSNHDVLKNKCSLIKLKYNGKLKFLLIQNRELLEV